MPKKIVDKNNVTTTRMVIDEADKKQLSSAVRAPLAAAPRSFSAGFDTIRQADNIDWNHTSKEDAQEMLDAASAGISKDNVWDAFKFYGGALDSYFSKEAGDSMLDNRVLEKIRDAFLDDKGIDINDQEAILGLGDAARVGEGEEDGITRYREEYAKVKDLLEDHPSVQAHRRAEAEAATAAYQESARATRGLLQDKSSDLGERAMALGNSIEWSALNVLESDKVAKGVTESLSGDNVIEAYNFYAKMAESDETSARSAARLNGVNFASKAAATWLESQGATRSDRESYQNITGPNGYEAYANAHAKFTDAMKRV